MKKVLASLAVCALAVACASTDDDRPSYPQRGGEGRGMRPAAVASDEMSPVPLNDWWHEPVIANALSLSSDQYAALDKISADQRDEVSRLERDSAMAMRELRETFDRDSVTSADITAAAQRARTLRDTFFDRQTQMLAAERGVLTTSQWKTLQQQLQADRSERRGNEGYGRRGRGGMGGGRGRWPGN